MPYTLQTSNGSFQILDGTLNSSNTTLALPGKNYAGYGLPVNQDLVDIVENYARYTQSDISNNSPLAGQLWFDTANTFMYYNIVSPSNNPNVTSSPPIWKKIATSDANYDVTFRSVTTSNITTGAPATAGTLTGTWTVANTLTVGVSGTAGTFLVNGGATVAANLTVSGSATVVGNTSSGNYTTSGRVTASEVVSTTGTITNISGTTANYTNGIFQNVTATNISAPGSNTWVIYNLLGNLASDSSFRYSLGTLNVPNIAATGNISANNISVANRITTNELIANIGNITTLTGTSLNYTNGTFSNITLPPGANITAPGSSGDMLFNRSGNIGNAGPTVFTYNTVTGILTVPGLTTTTGSISGNGAGLTNIPGANVTGIVPFAYNVVNGGNTETDVLTANTVITRVLTTGGNTITGSVTGNWTLTPGSKWNATYADLAERFEADTVYEAGTVVELGGTKEITAVADELSDRVFGVVSDTAGYLMNATAGDQATHPAIAMTGRVPVKVRGSVKKGDRLVSAGGGLARSAKEGEATAFNTVGRALADKLDATDGTVLSVVSVRP
jgi:hypothetical protein